MESTKIRANLMLLLAAAIWGFAFVAQRVGVRYVGSFTFNGIRFALGSISLLLPVLLTGRLISGSTDTKPEGGANSILKAMPYGIIAGLILFIAATLQQVGLVETSAGKAAFITGLYIVFVPIFGLFLKHKIGAGIWIGAAIAVSGLFLLCVKESFSISRGDLFELAGAVFWAIHILIIGSFVRKIDVLKLSIIQFATCSLLSIVAAVIFEKASVNALLQAAIPIIYGGVFSVGIAYTLQAIGQKYSRPSHAAIILSAETVFASLGGLVILGEYLSLRGYIGCLLILFGMLMSQLPGIFPKKLRINEVQ